MIVVPLQIVPLTHIQFSIRLNKHVTFERNVALLVNIKYSNLLKCVMCLQ